MTASKALSSLQAVDIGFGALLARMTDGLTQVGAPAALADFLKRPPGRRVLRGECSSPPEFLGKMRSAKVSASDEPGKAKANVPDLPIIGYYRKPNLMTVDPGEGGDLRQALRTFVGDREDATLLADLSQFGLLYDVLIVAPDRASLDALQLAWHFFVSGRGNNWFPVEYLLGGEPLPVRWRVWDNRTVLFDDVSEPHDAQGRMMAVKTAVEVRGPVLHGEWVDVPTLAVTYAWSDTLSEMVRGDGTA